VAAALEGRATLVVTGDPDLLALEEHQGVRIVNPRVFLGLVGGSQVRGRRVRGRVASLP
jgi:predicted nucleic acid-binding protein